VDIETNRPNRPEGAVAGALSLLRAAVAKPKKLKTTGRALPVVLEV